MKRFAILLPLAILALAGAAAAGEKKQADKTLPGVSAPPDIVTTLPPEPTDEPTDPTHFRIGNTEVRISGSLRIDMTTGNLPPPR
jgi:hypothetical protein